MLEEYFHQKLFTIRKPRYLVTSRRCQKYHTQKESGVEGIYHAAHHSAGCHTPRRRLPSHGVALPLEQTRRYF